MVIQSLKLISGGFTFSLNVNFKQLQNDTTIVTSGGNLPNGKGISLVYSGGKLHYVVSTSTQKWSLLVQHVLTLNTWHNLELTWNTVNGIEIYDNKKIVGSVIKPINRPHTSTHITNHQVHNTIMRAIYVIIYYLESNAQLISKTTNHARRYSH